MSLRRVVITGLGTINPLGSNIADFFDNLKKGVSGCSLIDRFDTTLFRTRFACQIKDYKWEDYFDRKEVRKYDPYTQFAIIASDQAVADAGLTDDQSVKRRTGVVWATGIGGIDSMSKELAEVVLANRVPKYSPFFILKMIPNIGAGYISIRHGFNGPSYCTSSACSSSTHAIISAYDQIRLGRADVMVAGGSEEAVSEVGVGGFNAMMALSTRNDDPATASRPYDRDRDGFVIGEGGGAVVLEEYEHALQRGATIYAEVVGTGQSADAYHITAPHPEGEGAFESMTGALREAGVEARQVDYLNTHGTSTPAGDLPELTAVERLFGDAVYDLNISSTKSMTGHLLGAAGAVEALATIMAINEGIIPPTINNFNLDPAIDPRLNLTLNKAQKREVKYAMSNTFGFGGQNATILLKKI